MTSNGKPRGREGPRKYAYNIDAAREREMHLYLPYWGFSTSEKFAQQSVGERPNVSRDHVLTAFAQLASLRLNAKCALISLFDRTTQHVVAESTPRLGLRSAASGEDSDSLWRGVQRLPRKNIPMCDQAMKSFTGEGKTEFLVPDLTKDSRFNSASFVTGAPFHKFYVSVPIKSPENYIIGSIAVLDDKPRDGLPEQDRQLLIELSITVMEYLLSQRAMREENREEKMVRALGLFVQGKSDLSEGIDSRGEPEKQANDLSHVNKKLEEVKISNSNEKAKSNSSGDRGRGSDSSEQPEAAAVAEQSRSRSPVRKFKAKEEQREESGIEKEENEERPSLTPTTEKLQESLAPNNVQAVLNRASCLMNQALDIEGAMFIDASVYTRRQMIGTDNKTGANAASENQGNQAPDYVSDVPETQTIDEEINGPKSLVLGYSTSTASSRDDNKLESHYVPLPGAFINHLIDRYPRGKIFHIEKDGSIALSYEGLADDVSQFYVGKENEIKPGSPKERAYQQEIMEIKYFHNILPEARCLAIYPVWDFHRSRWFTINLSWTNDPGRVLSEPKDLTYMAAFSNTVMAEVSRMDIEAADRAKGDFISSISHELRSPLHGVLGTVELLQETVLSYTQQGLVDTVYSCGRTLLDTLNHLLDYARINTLTVSRAPKDNATGSNGTSDKGQLKLTVPGLEQDEDLSSLVQEVVEGLLAGAAFHSRETDTATDITRYDDRRFSSLAKKGSVNSRMITIVDIEWQDNWHYSVYAGAWRRVVMNLFGNALKYTRTGYIRLLMRKDTMSKGGKNVPAVHITVGDSGRGMSQDFLLHNLYMPFLQEDTQSPGLGVGLHLVHQIVKSLDGQIQFKSEVGRGTDVDVYIPLTASQPSLGQPTTYHKLREELQGKSVSFFTKSFQRGDVGIRPEVFDNIRFSLGRMVSDWFGLEVLSSEDLDGGRKADFLIVTEREYRTMAHSSTDSDVRSSVESTSKSEYPLIVLSAQASSCKVVKEKNNDRAIFLSQPVSPKTLATVLENCLRPQGIEEDLKRTAPRIDSDISTPANETSNGNKPSTPDGSQKKVLLVEDNAVNLKIIETCVKNTGFAYETATDGLEAYEKFKQERFDIVVMDISMPRMDGLSATREMRIFEKSNKLKPAHVIILTAVLSAEAQEEARMSGVDEFLTKPAPLKQLSQLLRSLPHLDNPEQLE